MLEKQQKPIFLNLFQIAMPVTAIASILHRLSGLLLALFLPVFIYGFYLSTQGKAQFDQLMVYFENPGFKILLIILIWTISHHILAGIRYLLIDIELGVSLPAARLSAWIANIAAVIVTVLIALRLLS
ncbi:MAG: succinate dehydrogenase, cytochrome b556 subunit [Gammaproteobacteria bacterium]